MPVSTTVRDVFGHFQNLNLLVLIQDLRAGRTTRKAWLSGSLLCPVAHGLGNGRQVRELAILGQAAALNQGCEQAAHRLGADARAILRFVSSWDDEELGRESLLQQLFELWDERLQDA